MSTGKGRITASVRKVESERVSKKGLGKCNTPKYTLVVFDMFRVFCKPNLTVS